MIIAATLENSRDVIDPWGPHHSTGLCECWRQGKSRAIDCLHQNLGYASEAARAMIDYAFGQLKLRRILACTEYDNLASQGVMRKLGMTPLRNPHTEPPWLQIVGLLENRNLTTQ